MCVRITGVPRRRLISSLGKQKLNNVVANGFLSPEGGGEKNVGFAGIDAGELQRLQVGLTKWTAMVRHPTCKCSTEPCNQETSCNDLAQHEGRGGWHFWPGCT